MGLIARVPLASGFLTGKYSHEHRFHRTDWRARLGPQRRKQMLRRAEALDPVAQGVDSTRAQAALAFVLSYQEVGVTIPGIKTPEQAEENARSTEFAPLPREPDRAPRERLRRSGGRGLAMPEISLAILVVGVLMVADPGRLQVILDRVRELINWLAE